MYWLRTEHNRLNVHTFSKFDVGESEMCPCNADIMTAEHLLQHCQLHDALRLDVWPEPKLLRDKLYGNLEELKRTAAFVMATGICVYRTTTKKKKLDFLTTQNVPETDVFIQLYYNTQMEMGDRNLLCHSSQSDDTVTAMLVMILTAHSQMIVTAMLVMILAAHSQMIVTAMLVMILTAHSQMIVTAMLVMILTAHSQMIQVEPVMSVIQLTVSPLTVR